MYYEPSSSALSNSSWYSSDPIGTKRAQFDAFGCRHIPGWCQALDALRCPPTCIPLRFEYQGYCLKKIIASFGCDVPVKAY